MKQILQSLRTGVPTVIDAPAPGVRPKHLLIQTSISLISAGTERMLTQFGKAGLLEKARQQPDKVKDVLQKMRTDGVITTLEAVRAKLDQPIPMGYCNVGVVLAVGAGVTGFAIGDRVLSNGPHAEVVQVPVTLCAKIPDQVDDETAGFGVLGAIGLQGIRLANPSLGETFVVVGLGLIGLLTVQLLQSSGCRVVGIDVNPQRLALANSWGAHTINAGDADPVNAALAFSRGRGVDGVIVTAATASSEPMHQAAQMCRKRGRIVLVGVTGLELSRADFYEKELTFQVSCSYGPGRYDPDYEQKGNDYPVGFVRWTEQRNFEAVLDAMAAGTLDTKALVTDRFDISSAPQAYAALDAPGSLGIVLQYPQPVQDKAPRTIVLRPSTAVGQGRIAIIGAGNYASRVLGPAFKKAGAEIVAVVSNTGASSAIMARHLDAATASTDAQSVIENPSIDAVVIATPHSSHAGLVLQALKQGKHVFVEKPMALQISEIDEIEALYGTISASGHAPILTVGFNRRFSPLVAAMKTHLSSNPKSMIITVNAGSIPAHHWTQDPTIGGGRIIGEGCHFIDLARHLAESPIAAISARQMGTTDGLTNCGDTTTISVQFDDGSIASINYFANGIKSYPKERIEVFDNGRIYCIDNFNRLSVFGGKGGKRLIQQDKGQAQLVQNFMDAIRGRCETPIAADQIFEISRATIHSVN